MAAIYRRMLYCGHGLRGSVKCVSYLNLIYIIRIIEL